MSRHFCFLHVIEVEWPVTRPSPHRSLRAVFPHRAPQYYSLRTKAFSAFFAIPRSEVCICLSAFLICICFLCGLHNTVRLPFTLQMLFLCLIHLTFTKGGKRASQVPDTSLIACHAHGPRQPLGNLTFTIPLFWLPSR